MRSRAAPAGSEQHGAAKGAVAADASAADYEAGVVRMLPHVTRHRVTHDVDAKVLSSAQVVHIKVGNHTTTTKLMGHSYEFDPAEADGGNESATSPRGKTLFTPYGHVYVAPPPPLPRTIHTCAHAHLRTTLMFGVCMLFALAVTVADGSDDVRALGRASARPSFVCLTRGLLGLTYVGTYRRQRRMRPGTSG